MTTLPRYVKLAAAFLLVWLAVAPGAMAQVDIEPAWEETPFQEALRAGQRALENRRFEEAERELRRALTLVDGEPEEEQVYAAAYVRAYLASLYDAMHRQEDALEVHELVMEALSPPTSRLDDEDRAELHRQHANLLMQLARWDDAEEYTDLSFEYAKKWYGDDDPWALSYLVNRIEILMQTRRQQEAIDIHERIVETYTKVYGKDHPGLMSALSAAAFDAVMSGDSERSLAWQMRLLELDLNEKHETSQGLIYRYDWLGHEYANLGDTDHAIDSFNESIDLLERAYGEDHVNIAGNHSLIANAYLTTGSYQAALESFDSALEVIGEKDRDFPLWIDIMANKATVLRLLNRDDDADEALDELRTAINDN